MAKRSTAKNKKPPLSSKEAILEATIRVGHREGFRSVTIQKIADESGVAFGTVRYQFDPGQSDITHDAIHTVMKKTYLFLDQWQAEKRALKGHDPVCDYVEGMLSWIEMFPQDASVLCYFYYLNTTEVEIAPTQGDVMGRTQLRIESLIHEGAGRGLYARGLNAAKTAEFIFDVMMGAGMVIATRRNRNLNKERIQNALSVIQIYLQGRLAQT